MAKFRSTTLQARYSVLLIKRIRLFAYKKLCSVSFELVRNKFNRNPMITLGNRCFDGMICSVAKRATSAFLSE
jgi:hypothetical protein